MFGLSEGWGNYEDRKIARTEIGNTIISTASVPYSDQPYETAVASPHYNDGSWVIVDLYDKKIDAEEGHKRWCKKFADGNFPPSIEDVSSSKIKKFLDFVIENNEQIENDDIKKFQK